MTRGLIVFCKSDQCPLSCVKAVLTPPSPFPAPWDGVYLKKAGGNLNLLACKSEFGWLAIPGVGWRCVFARFLTLARWAGLVLRGVRGVECPELASSCVRLVSQVKVGEVGCVVLDSNTEPCGRALTQGLVGAAPFFHLVLPWAGEHRPPVGCGMLVCAGGLGQRGAPAWRRSVRSGWGGPL